MPVVDARRAALDILDSVRREHTFLGEEKWRELWAAVALEEELQGQV